MGRLSMVDKFWKKLTQNKEVWRPFIKDQNFFNFEEEDYRLQVKNGKYHIFHPIYFVSSKSRIGFVQKYETFQL